MKGNKKALLKLVKHFGSQKDLASEFDCSQQAISEWFKNGIPVERAVEAERKTKGAVKAVDLRPDVLRSIVQ